MCLWWWCGVIGIVVVVLCGECVSGGNTIFNIVATCTTTIRRGHNMLPV